MKSFIISFPVMSDSVKPFAPSPTTTPALSERQPSASSPPQQPSETEEEVRGIVGDEEHYDVERKKVRETIFSILSILFNTLMFIQLYSIFVKMSTKFSRQKFIKSSSFS